MTGIGYSIEGMAESKIAAPTKLADLWNVDPARWSSSTESRDTFGLGLLKLGIDPDPAKVTDDDLHSVHDDMQPLVNKGLRFLGQGYLQYFGRRRSWAGMVWSGDLCAARAAPTTFVFPEEGTMIWTDNMVIPKGATEQVHRRTDDELGLRPDRSPPRSPTSSSTSRRSRARPSDIKKIDPSAADEPAPLPDRRRGGQAAQLPVPVGRSREALERPDGRPVRP